MMANNNPLTDTEAALILWCLRTEESRCEQFLIAEAFDDKQFRIDYQKRLDCTISARRKIEKLSGDAARGE